MGKIERWLTAKLSSHSKSGLANALQVPVEYLEAVCRGTPIVAVSQLKFCAPCWTPGTPPDPLWMEVRAKASYVVLNSEIAVVIARKRLLLSSIASVLFVGLLTRLKLIFKASLGNA